MNPVALTATPPANQTTDSERARVGILLIEGHSATPMGPRIVFANEEAARFTGYKVESLMGAPIGLIYDNADLDHLIRALPSIAKSRNFCWMDKVLIQQNGQRSPYHWTIRPTNRQEQPPKYFTLTLSPLGEARSKPVAKSVLPVRNRIAGARQNTPAEKEAEPASEEILDKDSGRALAVTALGVAHDFKNALQAIKSNLELARIAVAHGEEPRDYLSEADYALVDAESLATQMLALSKGESGKKTNFQVEPLLKRVTHLCTAGTDVRPQLVTKQPHSWQVRGNSDAIYRVLHNLVMNACQAMPEGGALQLTADLTVANPGNPFQLAPGPYLVISIRDRGQGIPEQHLPKIFDARFTTKANGTGFGLYHCKRIVEEHGGSIQVASKPQVGTEFLVFLPAVEVSRQTASAAASGQRRQSGPDLPRKGEGNGRILVVEDQADVSRAACKMLDYLGYDCVSAASGETALELFREHMDSPDPVDLVLLDMTLPGGMNGYDVFRSLKRLDPRVTVIATSGYFHDNQSTTSLLEHGFAGILAKPYSMQGLAQKLDAVVASR